MPVDNVSAIHGMWESGMTGLCLIGGITLYCNQVKYNAKDSKMFARLVTQLLNEPL